METNLGDAVGRPLRFASEGRRRGLRETQTFTRRPSLADVGDRSQLLLHLVFEIELIQQQQPQQQQQ